MRYASIAVIYNPNSTGSSQELAEQFARLAKKQLPKAKIKLYATEHPGHGEELAYQLASAQSGSLIISSSGDGGYNEIINGVMRARPAGNKVATGLLPGGNANDHYSNLHQTDLLEQIAKNQVRKIDLLKITGRVKGELTTRYAHSYIGFGLTPYVGSELNKEKLNPIKEALIVVRSLFVVKSVPLRVAGKAGHYDSIVISNIDVMSKYLKISQPSKVDDGQFEVTIFRRRHRLRLIAWLLKASLKGVREDFRTNQFELETVQATSVQTDGEIINLDANSLIKIGVKKQILECII